MSARDETAGVLEETINLVYLGLQGSMGTRELIELVVECHNEALTAAGFSIVHKDEIHAPSVERAIAVAEAERKRHDVGDGFDSYPAHQAAFDIKDALRELMKEVGRG